MAAECPNCDFALGGLSDDEMVEFQRRRLRDRIYHLKMGNYAVITVFLAAFGWYWWQTAGFQQKSTLGPLLLLGVCAAAYLAMRALLFLALREKKKL
jgi:hypothetical protein